MDEKERHINKIRPFLDTEFIRKLMLFFNYDEVFDKEVIKYLTPEEILAKY